MPERMNPDQSEYFDALSRKIERAWRIVTYPDDYSESQVTGAENFLMKIRHDICDSLDATATQEELDSAKELMLGIFHYRGSFLMAESSTMPESEYFSIN